MNHPKYSEIANCVELKKLDEDSKFVKTTAVILQSKRTEIINLDLFKLCLFVGRMREGPRSRSVKTVNSSSREKSLI